MKKLFFIFILLIFILGCEGHNQIFIYQIPNDTTISHVNKNKLSLDGIKEYCYNYCTNNGTTKISASYYIENSYIKCHCDN